MTHRRKFIASWHNTTGNVVRRKIANNESTIGERLLESSVDYMTKLYEDNKAINYLLASKNNNHFPSGGL